MHEVAVKEKKDKKRIKQIEMGKIDNKKKQDVRIEWSKYKLNKVAGRIVKTKKIQDQKTFENPGKITPATFSGASIKANMLNVKLPPFSVVVLELK